jgi:two-component system, OmpR family, phosphate regulon sensor histidine kinase PhoR
MRIATFWAELRLALLVFAVSLVFGFFSGHLALSISIGLFAFIIWNLRQMMHLRRWLMAGAPINTVPNLHGSAYQIITKICDIKKHHNEEQISLERSLAKFDAATKAMPDAMLIVDQMQTIEWANPAAKSLLKIDLYRDIGQRIDNIVRDPEITSYLNNQVFDEPLEFSSANSSEIDLMLRVVSYDDGKKLLIVHDHSDLLHLQNVRKEFVSNASHEMRTPLTVIIGYLETLSLREEMSPITRRGVDGALEQAQRLKRLIEDLLSLSRLESLPLTKNKLEKIDITMLIREGIELLKSADIYKNQYFNSNTNSGVQINGDYRELQSAIQNILDNAVKYSPVDSHIEISWDKLNDGGSLLTVTNDGDGIDASHIPRLTERFYRIDRGRSRDMGGTGLGLSIVKHIMQRHNGELRVRSQKQVETSVELYFPEERNVYEEQQVS